MYVMIYTFPIECLRSYICNYLLLLINLRHGLKVEYNCDADCVRIHINLINELNLEFEFKFEIEIIEAIKILNMILLDYRFKIIQRNIVL